MPREVNVYTSGWRATGVNVPVPQYELTIQVDWIDDDGQPHTRTETVQFPNVLTQVPAAWVAKEMKDILYRALRVKAGIDTNGL